MPVLVAEGWDRSRRGAVVSEGPSASPQETPSSHFTNGPHEGVQGPGLKQACLSVCKSNTPTPSPPSPEGGLTLMCGWMSTSQGRRLQRRLSCSGQQRLLTLEMRVETPRPQVVEQGLQGLV